MMLAFSSSILIIVCMTSIMCAIPGVFLVLHSCALMSDALSHAILPGIVVMFLCIHSLDSPLLIFGAALSGLLTVLITQALSHKYFIKKDSAIGLVFPVFFSTGVLLISIYAYSIHLDSDMILLGEVVFAPFKKLIITGYDYGPTAIWNTGILISIQILCITLFFKEIVYSIFDSEYAYLSRIKPTVVFYVLMIITSLSATIAFDIVGSFVVVALMITPAATAWFVTNRIIPLLCISCVLALISAIDGYLIAHFYDVSIAGAIAVSNGLLFILFLVIAPEKGILSQVIQRRRLRNDLKDDIVCYTIYSNNKKLLTIEDIAQILNWSTSSIDYHVYNLERKNFVDSCMRVTTQGIKYLRSSYPYMR